MSHSDSDPLARLSDEYAQSQKEFFELVHQRVDGGEFMDTDEATGEVIRWYRAGEKIVQVCVGFDVQDRYAHKVGELGIKIFDEDYADLERLVLVYDDETLTPAKTKIYGQEFEGGFMDEVGGDDATEINQLLRSLDPESTVPESVLAAWRQKRNQRIAEDRVTKSGRKNSLIANDGFHNSVTDEEKPVINRIRELMEQIFSDEPYDEYGAKIFVAGDLEQDGFKVTSITKLPSTEDIAHGFGEGVRCSLKLEFVNELGDGTAIVNSKTYFIDHDGTADVYNAATPYEVYPTATGIKLVPIESEWEKERAADFASADPERVRKAKIGDYVDYTDMPSTQATLADLIEFEELLELGKL